MNHDNRGSLTELYRKNWHPSIPAVQWDVVTSRAGVMRGVHVHRHRTDYLSVVKGKMCVGLKDMRASSPTKDLACTIQMDAANLQLLIIPTGIAHGIWSMDDSILMFGMDHYWDSTDDNGCYWNDAELGIAWPCDTVLLSERDSKAQSYRDLVSQMDLVCY